MINKSDILIATNHGIGVSLCFLLKRKRIKDKKIYIINSGIFEEKLSNNIRRAIRNYFINLTTRMSKKIIFTSEEEYNFAIKNKPSSIETFTCIPFCVDSTFWGSQKNDFSNKHGILFVGNNEFRDISLLIKIAKKLKNIEFIAVTTLIKDKTSLPSNLKVITGDWNKSIIEDLDLKNLYEKVRMTILPIKANTITASGQSVSLQSMAAGTPVLISKTDGFWESKQSEKEYIVLVDSDKDEEWCEKISDIYSNENMLKNISENAKDRVNKELSYEIFNKKMKELLEL